MQATARGNKHQRQFLKSWAIFNESFITEALLISIRADERGEA